MKEKEKLGNRKRRKGECGRGKVAWRREGVSGKGREGWEEEIGTEKDGKDESGTGRRRMNKGKRENGIGQGERRRRRKE